MRRVGFELVANAPDVSDDAFTIVGRDRPPDQLGELVARLRNDTLVPQAQDADLSLPVESPHRSDVRPAQDVLHPGEWFVTR